MRASSNTWSTWSEYQIYISCKELCCIHFALPESVSHCIKGMTGSPLLSPYKLSFFIVNQMLCIQPHFKSVLCKYSYIVIGRSLNADSIKFHMKNKYVFLLCKLHFLLNMHSFSNGTISFFYFYLFI